jgi:hypothetical protein
MQNDLAKQSNSPNININNNNLFSNSNKIMNSALFGGNSLTNLINVNNRLYYNDSC